MRTAALALIVLGLGLADVPPDAKKKVPPSPPSKTKVRDIEARRTTKSTCVFLSCGNTPTTRQAVVPISDDAFLAPLPNPICACPGDVIEWTYDNLSTTKDKEVYIQDVIPFLSNGDCKKPKPVKKVKKEKATCQVTAVKAGIYKYNIKGSHFLDPEVEIEGGIHPASPSPSPHP
jgi:hypothetical protein